MQRFTQEDPEGEKQKEVMEWRQQAEADSHEGIDHSSKEWESVTAVHFRLGLHFHYQLNDCFIFLTDRLVIWSIKCHTMVNNIHFFSRAQNYILKCFISYRLHPLGAVAIGCNPFAHAQDQKEVSTRQTWPRVVSSRWMKYQNSCLLI